MKPITGAADATDAAKRQAPRIIVARHAGVCYGVERALDMAYDAARDAVAPVNTLGELIHNPRVVAELSQAGVGLAASVDEAHSGTVIIRAHGVVPSVIEEARAHGLSVVDATCPYVKKVHAAAKRLSSEGYQVIVVGEEGHPEVEGIMGHAGPSAHVVSAVSDLDVFELARRVGVVVQTTQTDYRLAAIVSALVTRVQEVRVINTICKATHERQESAAALASHVDAMIVVGGKNSGNTRRLAQICLERCPHTQHVESAEELDPRQLAEASIIGITAGASTPAEHIRQVVAAVRDATGGELYAPEEEAEAPVSQRSDAVAE